MNAQTTPSTVALSLDEAAMAARLKSLTGRALVCAHLNPDGDAIGAAVGLCHALRAAHIEAFCWGFDPIPELYRFLHAEDFLLSIDAYTPKPTDTIIVLDCGGKMRLPEPVRPFLGACPLLCIDHHHSGVTFAAPFLLEENAGSCSEIVYRVAKAAGFPVSRNAAEAFWTGIITDTGRFMYDGTSARTLQTAAELRDLGVRTSLLNDLIFGEQPVRRLLLLRHFIDHIRHDPAAGVALSWLGPEDYAAEGCTAEDSENFVNTVRGIQGVKLAAFLRRVTPEDDVHISLRTSEPFDASAICAGFGGGGHVRAAGATVCNTPLEIVCEQLFERLLHEVRNPLPQ